MEIRNNLPPILKTIQCNRINRYLSNLTKRRNHLSFFKNMKIDKEIANIVKLKQRKKNDTTIF